MDRKIERELEKFEEFKMSRDELDYTGDGGLAPCTGKQRGYIYGLLDKLGAEPEDYGINGRDGIRDLTIAEASELIERLKEDEESAKSGYTTWGKGYDLW